MAIVAFFVGHWTLSVFFQTFFLHRYGAHRMFTMSKRWERVMYLLTYVTQGSSFLVPKGYAVLHRMHHAYSDTEKDPHSPRNFSNAFTMMWATKKTYHDYAHGVVQPEARFAGGIPEWPAVDALGRSWVGRLAWGAAYTLFYLKFATAPWQFALLPFHYVMGPVHGAIVNWCGHRYGYRNFASDDDSKNTLIFDFVTLGELFQNNHHKFGMAPNFAVRWFELDPTWQVMRVLSWLGIIELAEKPQVGKWQTGDDEARPAPVEAPAAE
ncbi:MAG TPA: acyl-CoA desaturase [Minicystis sp.]|nr:acyl-CoA desaturase [Minicystis sp.]